MHSTAKKCVQWAVALFVSGAILLVYGTDLYLGLAGVAGANAEAGLGVVNILLTLVRSTAFPIGAVLIGAARGGQGRDRRQGRDHGDHA